MPSRHGSEQSLESPPHPLLYTMGDMDLPPTQHPSLTNLERYDMYEAPPPTFGEGMGPVRPKRKQVKNACSACQRACKRCDVGRPCERCIKYGMADSCRDSQRKERKKGIKRGPYKKRDGECAVPHDPVLSAHSAPAGTATDVRMSPKRMARVASVPEVDLSAANLIQIDADTQPMQMQQPVPSQVQVQPQIQSVRPDAYSYQTPVMMPAHTTPPLSLAAMHPQQYNTNQPSSSYHHSEEQYYPTRYDHLHAPARSAHFRNDDSCSQPHQDYSRHVQPAQDYSRSPHALQYPSPEQSPPRERQYTNAVYHDNSSRHSVVQPVHHDPSYQSQSDSMAHDDTHDTRIMDPYYQHQQHQRPYPSEAHMPDVHPQQDHQQSYYNYNAYQSTSYGSSQQYGYSQGHVSQQMSQGQNDAGYSHQHLNYSVGSSVTYPVQSHHQMDNSVQLQYSMRSPVKMVHRASIDATGGMVAHPHQHPQHHHHHHSQHVGNVQIQSN
ncbi:hypothetical protein FRC11_006823 [Ceratobasidium sp. 423]|nr:hypothetical protein FRC11_006823 [Ceratobasidium sp. 423]